MLCAAALGLAWTLEVETFDLAWTHSVERTEWVETWRVAPDGLVLERAWVEGTGAGMEVPDGAVPAAGGWAWTPNRVPQPALHLARSGTVADWRLCIDGLCRPLQGWLPGLPGEGTVTLAPCPAT